MPKHNIYVPLEQADARALIDMAQTECRHPREQMVYLLRAEAQRRGLLPGAASVQTKSTEATQCAPPK
jgi:hypothetical protein